MPVTLGVPHCKLLSRLIGGKPITTRDYDTALAIIAILGNEGVLEKILGKIANKNKLMFGSKLELDDDERLYLEGRNVTDEDAAQCRPYDRMCPDGERRRLLSLEDMTTFHDTGDLPLELLGSILVSPNDLVFMVYGRGELPDFGDVP